MSDGHTGGENPAINRGGSGDFELVLSALEQGTGQIDFVIHATSDASYFPGSRLQPLDFLNDIGLSHYEGNCPFHSDRCYYLVIKHIPAQDVAQFKVNEEADEIHEAFRRFSEHISELFQLREKEQDILSEIGVKPPKRTIF